MVIGKEVIKGSVLQPAEEEKDCKIKKTMGNETKRK